MANNQFAELTAEAVAVLYNPTEGAIHQPLTVNDYRSHRVDAITVTVVGPASVTIDLWMTLGAYAYTVGSSTVPAGAGLGGTPAVDLVPLLAPVNLGGFVIPPGWILECSLEAANGVSTNCQVVAFGGLLP